MLSFELSPEQKIPHFLNVIYDKWKDEAISGTDTFTVLTIESLPYISIWQQDKILRYLKDKYKCLDYRETPMLNSRDEAEEHVLASACDEYTDEEIFQRDVREAMNQKIYTIRLRDNFQEVFTRLTKEVSTVYRLRLKERSGGTPVLYVNDVPIRKFQNSSYVYRMIKIALGLPNGSRVLVRELLKDNRGDRGCSQELADIFRQSALRVVFARDITKDSFTIFHHITIDDLENNESFQKLMNKEKASSNTTFLAKKIEDSRISL